MRAPDQIAPKLYRMICVGIGVLIIATAISFMVPGPVGASAKSQILSAQSADPNFSIRVVKTAGHGSVALVLESVSIGSNN